MALSSIPFPLKHIETNNLAKSTFRSSSPSFLTTDLFREEGIKKESNAAVAEILEASNGSPDC